MAQWKSIASAVQKVVGLIPRVTHILIKKCIALLIIIDCVVFIYVYIVYLFIFYYVSLVKNVIK